MSAAALPPPTPSAAPSDALPKHLWLLEALGRATPKAAADPPRSRRVFVNRTVRMEDIDVLGFDMDYTLALYHQPRLEALSAACTLRKMVEERGYSKEILAFPYDARFAIRGLVVDKKTGNLLKMDRYGFVGRGYHGTRPLSRSERMRLYREEHVRILPARYAWIDTLFALPEAVLYAQGVDFLDRDATFLSAPAEVRAVAYMKLWQDIRECIDEAHRDDSIKREISTHLEDYILYDPELAPTLHRFRSAGKRLFVLTNSGFDYTNTVMSYLLNDRLPSYANWQSYFDAVIVDAKKPAFFVEDRPLIDLDKGPTASGGRGIFQGGNVRALGELLSLNGDRVMYVGDHIYGDMLRAKRSSVWRTAMIVQELEDELLRHAEVEEPLKELEALDRRHTRIDAELRYQQLLAAQLAGLRAGQVAALPPSSIDPATLSALSSEVFAAAGHELSRRVEDLRSALVNTLAAIDRLESAIETAFNPYWGPLFKEGTENSRLGQQVEDYACLYTSRVSNFLAYSPFQYFRSPRDHLPHERVY